MPCTVPVNVHVKSTDTLTIGDIAARFGLPTHVLRHWEAMGLLEPERDGAGRRRYGEADLERVAGILMGKRAGLGLRDIAAVFASGDPMARNDILGRHVAELTGLIARATAAKDLITHAMECPLPFDECPHAREQIRANIPPAR
jgi:MerR family transcriptional regulator, copper efflux regulator